MTLTPQRRQIESGKYPLTLFDMGGGHDGPPKMFLTTVSKRVGGGS